MIAHASPPNESHAAHSLRIGPYFEAFLEASAEDKRRRITKEELHGRRLHLRHQSASGAVAVDPVLLEQVDPWWRGMQSRYDVLGADGLLHRHEAGRGIILSGHWDLADPPTGCDPTEQYVVTIPHLSRRPRLFIVRRQPNWGWLLLGVLSLKATFVFPRKGEDADNISTYALPPDAELSLGAEVAASLGAAEEEWQQELKDHDGQTECEQEDDAALEAEQRARSAGK